MSSAFEALFATEEPPDLGPAPRAGVLSEAAVDAALDEVFRKCPVRNRQPFLKALVLLWHDHLEAAHTLAQEMDTADGAFLHGIMHRREPDYSNAAYWFRRVGRHTAFPELGRRAAGRLVGPEAQSLRRELLPRGEWDPFAFIGACERVISLAPSDNQRRLVRDLQSMELQTLLDYFLDENSAGIDRTSRL